MNKFLKLVLVCVAVFAMAPLAWADCSAARLQGVNLAGAEFNAKVLPGKVFKDYVYPTADDMRHFNELGMNTFRLPFRWERVQPELFGELNRDELKQIAAVIATAATLDSCVILDVHNYGEYRAQPIGSDAVPAAALVDLWQRLLVEFDDPAHTAFGLMNEPAKLPVAEWADAAQQVVLALRKQGAKHLLVVPGGRWSGAHDWHAAGLGTSNADAFRNFRDPRHNYVIEVHQYADDNFSGMGASCIEHERLRKIMQKISAWSKATHQKLFLGEFGVPANPQCLESLAVLMDEMADNSAWRGFAYWAAGRWWGAYPFSIQPDQQGDRPQMEVLKRYLRPQRNESHERHKRRQSKEEN